MAKNTKSGNAKTGNKKRKDRKGNSNKILIAILLGVVIPLLLIYLYFGYFYKSHFYNNTLINSVNTSNMTTNEAEERINEQVKSYTLTISGRNGLTDTISGDEINLHTVFAECLPDLLEKQNTLVWPSSMLQLKELNVDTMLKYDDELLKEVYHNLSFLQAENIITPENASISEYTPDGYVIIPENPGTQVVEDNLYDAIVKSIDTLQPSLSIEDTVGYTKPEITSDHPELLLALDEMNKISGAEITYEFGEDKEILDGNKINSWISLDDNYKVNFDTNGIKEFVDYIGKTYNSFGRTREFTTSYGDVIQLAGGDYGWWLNRPAEVEELTKLIQNGEKLTRTPVYFQTAQQYGKDDIGNTYVEVNLTAQHLFFYKEGELILDTDFVSGNISKELGTPTGTYPVQYKDNDATLVGEDYATPVKYWMPFNKNIGFHDATWRKDFGKDIYLTNGSHGCINMPPKMAKKMYQNIQRGVAVVVYELPGTENYEVKDATDATLDYKTEDANSTGDVNSIDDVNSANDTEDVSDAQD